ncbi:MAG TPA: glycosyltransferase [Terracidiphilus sp.]|jgi:peptidoglycan/xylan/chitin deacetylase (PgdA/CDA1 family)/glycosyltransferase involved in cell wall biosynthesis|nr:glycosyltransferase [Terracidiphilus sp.]
MKLSVVVPTFNRKPILERALHALASQDLSPEQYELIVAVDGSTDGTVEMLRAFQPECAFHYLEIPHGGPSAARNAGIRTATGELILFLDDDLIAVPDLLRQHCESHVDSAPRVVHGPIYISPESAETIIRYVSEEAYEGYYRSPDLKKELRYPEAFGSSIAVLSSLANSSMPRELLIQCGGFDEQIRAAEDLELGLRLWRLGVSFAFLPNAIAREIHVKSSWEYLQWQSRTLAVGDIRASRKHPEYRPYSLFSSLGETRLSTKWLRNALVRFPLSPVPLLAFPLHFEKYYCRFLSLRRMGMRLLQIAERITRLRSGKTAAGSWQALENEFGKRCPVLMYHHIGPSRPGAYRELTVSPEKFEQQIRWLSRWNYVAIQPSHWLRWRKEGAGLPQKPICITFDDAYEDIAEYALPILRRYGFSAAVFVVTGEIAGTNAWDEAQGSGTLRLMNAETIRSWAAQGIEFGAHSRTHADLTKLSASQCRDEIAGSKSDLAAILGSPVLSFAYPYGEYNEAVCNIVRDEFELAFSTIEGLNDLQTDPHLIRRAAIGPDDSLLGFAMNVRFGGQRAIKDLRIKLGVRTRLKRALKRFSGTRNNATN